MESLRVSKKYIKNFCIEEVNAVYLDCNIYEGENQISYLRCYLYYKYQYSMYKYKYSKDSYKECYNKLNQKIKDFLKSKKIKSLYFNDIQILYSCSLYGNTGQLFKFESNKNIFYIGF